MEKQLQPKLRFPEFSGDWNKSKIQNLSKFIGGGTPDTSNNEFWDGDIPWISSSDIIENEITNINITRYISKNAIENSATKLIPKGSLLVVSRVGVGKFAIASQDICTSQDFTNLILDKKHINNLFLAYQLYANRNVLYRISQGTSIKGFTSNDLKTVSVFITSLPEQQKIADYLTTIDKKIELLKDKKEELSRYKKAMMQKLFSQEIRFKDENGNDYPEWEKKIRLTDIAKISIGVVTTMTENYRDFGTKLIRNSDISPMKLSDSLIYLDNSFSELYENRKLHKGDIVTVHTGNVGVSAVIEDSFIGSIGFATINTRPNVSIVNSYFLAYYFNSKKFINWCIAYSTGDGRRNLNLKDFNKVILDLPSLPEQQKIANFLSAIDESITKVEEQIKETQNFKKAMLQQLFV